MRSRLASAALACTLLGGAAAPAVLMAPGAAAHSVLLSVDPADGATLDAAPDRVALTFNEDINPSFATVAVTGADRTSRVRGEAEVEGPRVSVGLEGLDDGEYTIGYRVTSADGHVISGSTRFSVGSGGADAGAAGSADAAATGGEGSNAAADAEAGGGAEAGADDGAAGADDGATVGSGAALWIVGGLAVLLIGAAAFLLRGGRNS